LSPRRAAAGRLGHGRGKLSLLASDASALDIETHAHAGVVTLFGSVESEQQKAEAGERTAKIKGVRGVRNQLQVVTSGEREAVEQRDAAIEPEVEQRLAADRELARAGLDVDVSNGVVWLEGDVSGRGVRRNAITLARTTTGVRAVVAALHVETE
jgi:osmotically-inducible protein OsmY